MYMAKSHFLYSACSCRKQPWPHVCTVALNNIGARGFPHIFLKELFISDICVKDLMCIFPGLQIVTISDKGFLEWYLDTSVTVYVGYEKKERQGGS